MNLFFLLPATKFQIKAQNCTPKDRQTTELETWGMVPKAGPDIGTARNQRLVVAPLTRQQQGSSSERALSASHITPESRKRGRRSPLEALKSQEFVGGRVGTNSGSWCAESRSLSGNSHEKKPEERKLHSWYFCWFGWEKIHLSQSYGQKKKNTYIPGTFRSRLDSDTKTITKQGAAGQMNVLQLEVSTLLHHTKVLWLLWL